MAHVCPVDCARTNPYRLPGAARPHREVKASIAPPAVTTTSQGRSIAYSLAGNRRSHQPLLAVLADSIAKQTKPVWSHHTSTIARHAKHQIRMAPVQELLLPDGFLQSGLPIRVGYGGPILETRRPPQETQQNR